MKEIVRYVSDDGIEFDSVEECELYETSMKNLLELTTNENGLISIDLLTKSYTSYVLARCGNNATKASEILGISRSTLWRNK